MTETLEDDYPEAAPYIRDAVDDLGEEWVLGHYYEQIYPLGRLMDLPEKEDLSFYEADEHDSMTEAERVEMYEAWAAYRENLREESRNAE
jgi:hypothetical protein